VIKLCWVGLVTKLRWIGPISAQPKWLDKVQPTQKTQRLLRRQLAQPSQARPIPAQPNKKMVMFVELPISLTRLGWVWYRWLGQPSPIYLIII